MKLYIFCIVLAVCLLFAVQVQSSPIPDVSEDINTAVTDAFKKATQDFQDLKPKWDSFVNDSQAMFKNFGKNVQEFFDKSVPKTE